MKVRPVSNFYNQPAGTPADPNPPAIEDAIIWLRGDSIVDAGGGVVDYWADKSSTGVDMIPAPLNIDGIPIATWTGFNNRLAVNFDGSGTLRYDGTGIYDLADAKVGGFSYILVFSGNTTMIGGHIFNTCGPFTEDRFFLNRVNSSILRVQRNCGSWIEDIVNHGLTTTNTIFEVCSYYSDGSFAAFVNGNAAGPSTWNTDNCHKIHVGQNKTLFIIADWDYPSAPDDGWWPKFQCAELLYYNRSLTSGEMDDVNQYFTDYYGM